MGSKMDQFYIWDKDYRAFRLNYLPKPFNLKDLTIEQLLDFVDMLKGERGLVIYHPTIQFDLTRFWRDLSLELLFRIDLKKNLD